MNEPNYTICVMKTLEQHSSYEANLKVGIQFEKNIAEVKVSFHK